MAGGHQTTLDAEPQRVLGIWGMNPKPLNPKPKARKLSLRTSTCSPVAFQGSRVLGGRETRLLQSSTWTARAESGRQKENSAGALF